MPVPRNWIQVLKYSPDGNTLAVGTHGMVIALLNVSRGYLCQGVLTAHNAAVTQLDWSADGRHIRSKRR